MDKSQTVWRSKHRERAIIANQDGKMSYVTQSTGYFPLQAIRGVLKVIKIYSYMHLNNSLRDVKVSELNHWGCACAPDHIFNDRNESGPAGQVAQA